MKMVDIDGEAVRKELKSRGKSLKDVSEEIGYSANYLKVSIDREKVSIPAFRALTTFYAIPAENIRKKEAGPIANDETALSDDTTLRLLQTLIQQNKTQIRLNETIVSSLEGIGKLQTEIISVLSENKKTVEAAGGQIEVMLTKSEELVSKLNKFHYDWKNNTKYGTR